MQRLKQQLLKWLPCQSMLETAIKDLTFSRYDEQTSRLRCFYAPMAAIVVQGTKRSLIGDFDIVYKAGQCIVVGMDVPGIFSIIEASPENPYLTLSIKLDRQIISQLLAEMPPMDALDPGATSPVVVAEAPPRLIDAFTRLVDLLDTPAWIPTLAPLFLREIHFYLLNGLQAGCLRLFHMNYAQSGQITQAIAWLREHFRQSISMLDLAKQVNLAPSTFNQRFKQMTGVSPLQFQKKMRLYEAERLLIQEGRDISSAAREVGYESMSQFNREYKRQFGNSPHNDVIKKCSG